MKNEKSYLPKKIKHMAKDEGAMWIKKLKYLNMQIENALVLVIFFHNLGKLTLIIIYCIIKAVTAQVMVLCQNKIILNYFKTNFLQIKVMKT